MLDLPALWIFFRIWNLEVDSAKSYCWALTTGARKQLALWPFKTVTSATELGAVLSFTKRHCTGQQLKKFMALKTRWKALQQSWAPHPPQASHFATHLLGVSPSWCFWRMFWRNSPGQVEKLRHLSPETQAVGANSMLRLGLSSSPTADPGLGAPCKLFELPGAWP